MAYADVDKVLALRDKRLSGTDFAVLVVLASHKNKETGQCNPGYALIGAEACLSKSTVQSTIQRLMKFGRISVKPGGGGLTRNDYSLHLEAIFAPSTVPTVGAPHTDSQYGTVPEVGGEPVSQSGKNYQPNQDRSVPVGSYLSSRDKTEGQEQQQGQRQQQGQKQPHGGNTPEPPTQDTRSVSVRDSEAEELLSVWKQLTSKPGYLQDFVRLLENNSQAYSEQVLEWAFTVSNFWASESPNWKKGFDVKSSGVFISQFAKISASYESFMKRCHAEEKDKGNKSGLQRVAAADKAEDTREAKEARENAALYAYLTQDWVGFDEYVEELEFERDDWDPEWDNDEVLE